MSIQGQSNKITIPAIIEEEIQKSEEDDDFKVIKNKKRTFAEITSEEVNNYSSELEGTETPDFDQPDSQI